jgi:hypothetical protein
MLSGGLNLKGLPEERAVMLAEYIIENNATVRCAAKAFGISKSTVHKDLMYRLPKCNKALYCGVYPYSQFCNPNGCKERLKEYFDKKIEDSAKRIVDGVIKTFLKNNTF